MMLLRDEIVCDLHPQCVAFPNPPFGLLPTLRAKQVGAVQRMAGVTLARQKKPDISQMHDQ